MGGLLTRGPDGWYWSDGTREARVRDLTAAEAFQFPRVVYPDPDAAEGRSRWVSFPVSALDDEPDLDELVRELGSAARNSTHDAGRIEVREDVWDAHVRGRVIGVLWDAADEAELLAIARRLRT
jgi:hypothetical protein